ncbi:hypothetical protein B296_00043749 [Ensete ventricosum]|uniref:Uncharacterized protein n=1 Tax=Ensete ventricosum TaxID=4639 RepID=A0A426ZDE7_ENSVE|nr:hypothetical protein B296_00043749 [Ensete ventricosum]
MIIALLPGQRLAAFRQEATMLLDKTARVHLWDLTGGESAEESPDFAIELADLVDAFYDRLDGVSVRADRDPGGYHEYIDVIAKGNACSIVDINIVIEFEIAKPTTDYMTLLRVLSVVFIGIIKGAGMHVLPWRWRDYVEAKWFNSYGRTTDGVFAKEGAVWVVGEATGGVAASCWWWEAM